MPHVAAPNRVFRNAGELRFTDATKAWGLDRPGFSNGAVYVDLDNRGALDLVVSSINAPAEIYRNRGRTGTGNSSLTVTLRGEGGNTAGIGAKLFVRTGQHMQLLEQSPTRGFQSSVDPRLHVGLGRATAADSVTVVWPDRRYQVLTNVPANRPLVLSQRDANGRWAPPVSATPLFREVSTERGVDVRHVENDFVDFEREPLMPRLLSTEGPALATADVNGDGLDDLFLGGGVRQAGRLMVQQRDGTFRSSEQPSIAADSIAEDVDAAFLDANGDGAPDLYVVSGGNQFLVPAPPMRGRLYLNDGHGRFSRDAEAIPALYDNGGCVAAGDFDGDGHVDLFLGSRSVPGRYGASPKSHLLRNDGRGRFVDVTAERAPGLSDAGMITSAAWLDYDGDGRLDLVTVGEWTPVRVFHQEQGRFVERTERVGLDDSEGWWNAVTVADVDGDRHPDLVLGNLGLNSYITASRASPSRLFAGDFAHDGSFTPILTIAGKDGNHPVAGRDELLRAIPSLRDRFPTYASFGASTIEQLVPSQDLRAARTLVARTFASAVARNDGRGKFVIQPLPVEAQLAPVHAIVADDFDRDGTVDLLLGGNFHGVPPIQGRYDASYGLLLRGLGSGRFAAVDMMRSGVEITGQVRRLRSLRTGDGSLVAVARNDDRLLLLQPGAPASRPRPVASTTSSNGSRRAAQ
jgi:hypothetical protein